MKSCILVLLSGLVSVAQSSSDGGVVQLAFERKSVPAEQALRRRSSTVEVATGNQIWNYQVNASVGTPPQHILMSLDTGSSDMILRTTESDNCKKYKGECPGAGTNYNANKSSTYTYLNSNFTANFGFSDQGEGTSATGDVVTDNFTIGGTTIQKQQFAVAYGDVSISFSILGISYASGETQVSYLGKPSYNNLPLSLAASGAINLPLFSLWQDKDSIFTSHTGQILFGGIDQAKYDGELEILPIQTRTGFPGPVAFDINMNGFALSANGSTPINSTGTQLTVVDCGTSFSIIQDTWLDPIYEKFGITYTESNDSAIVDCALAKKDYTLDFSFKNLTIKAPIANFVSEIARNVCTFDVVKAGSREALIGTNFLNSAVVVFDLGNDEVSLAKRDFGGVGEKVVAVPKGGVAALNAGTTAGTSGSAGGSASGTTTAGTSSETEAAKATGSVTSSQTGTTTTTGSAASSSSTKKSGAAFLRTSGYLFETLAAISCLLTFW